ncbi:MAG: hypothetical protein IT285_11985 [Bdellovibrionales bacterium]|nr:hypothetical protein [Bdellovibrionales bacterium]
MAKKAAQPSAAETSFGAAALLGEKGRVYYENLFSAAGVGRVTDLMAAKLRESGVDGPSIRALLLFGFYEGYLGTGATEGVLPDPITLECGVDEVTLAVSIGFTIDSELLGDLDASVERVRGQSVEISPFERFLRQLLPFAATVWLKVDAKTRRAELACSISLKDAASLQGRDGELRYVRFERAPEPAPKPETYELLSDLPYTELLKEDGPAQKVEPSPAGQILADAVRVDNGEVKVGDLRKAAEEETRVEGKRPGADEAGRAASVPGEPEAITTVGGAPKGEPERKLEGAAETGSQTRVQGAGPDSDGSTQVSGAAQDHTLAKTIVKAGAREDAESVFLVAGGADGQSKKARRRVLGGGGGGEADGDSDELLKVLAGGVPKRPDQKEPEGLSGEVVAQAYQRKVSQLMARIRELEANANANAARPLVGAAAPPGDSSSVLAALANEISPELQAKSVTAAVPSEPPQKPSFLGDLLGKMGPVKKPKVESAEDQPTAQGAEAETSAEAADAGEEKGEADESSLGDETIDLKDVPDEKTAIRTLLMEIDKGGLERAIEGLKKDTAGISGDKNAKRFKRVAEDVLQLLTAEKAKLYSLTRKLNWSVKRRDMEFKNKEKALLEELKRREEMLKKKDTVVSHVRSQMAQLNMNMERLKNTASSAVEDGQFRKRFEHLQKLYTAGKDESMRNLREIDRLKKQLTTARFQAASQSTPAEGELVQLRESADKFKRQAEEFKRMNKQLVDRISQLEKHKASSLAGGRMEEMRERLDQAMRAVTSSKGETEGLKAKLQGAEGESKRLEQELAKTRDTLRRATDKMRRYLELNKRGEGGSEGGSSSGAA